MREIILGPPGTGKTTTLITIVDDELIAGTPPERIGYLSFTRRAATEAVSRSMEKFGVEKKMFPWFRTLHSMSFKFLGLSSGIILEGTKLTEFSHFVGEKITGKFNTDEGSFSGYDPGDRMLFMDNLARVRGITLREQYDMAHDDLEYNRVWRFSETLKEFKAARRLVDYTDMLEMFRDMDESPPLDVLIVDEAQDLSRLQWQVVDKIAAHCRRVAIAGDDDQAIYRWAGADVDHLINMEGDRKVLGQSWRVPVKVQEVALEIISKVHTRIPKEWAPREAQGQVIYHRKMESIDWSGEEDILVLARNVSVLQRVKNDLHASGMLYEFKGFPSVPAKTLRAIRAWEDLRAGKAIPVSEVRHAYEMMTTGIGVARGFKTLPKFDDDDYVNMEILHVRGGLKSRVIWHEALDKIPAVERSYIVRCRRRGEKLTATPRIKLSTIHGAKGAEATRVILLLDMAPRTEIEYKMSPEDEHRCWYVAVTRAKKTLEIVAAQTLRSYRL